MMKEIDCQTIRKFQCGDYPEFIYVIKSGFEDLYIVVYEDAYEVFNEGLCEYYNKTQLEEKFKIKLTEAEPNYREELDVKCFYRGGSMTVTIVIDYPEISDDDIVDMALTELQRRGSGYNSEMIDFQWNRNGRTLCS